MKTISCIKCAHPLHVEADWSWDFKKCPVCGQRTDLPKDWHRLPDEESATLPEEGRPETWQPPVLAASKLGEHGAAPRGVVARLMHILWALLMLAVCGYFVVVAILGVFDYVGGDSRLAADGVIVEASVRAYNSRRLFRVASHSPQISFEYRVNEKKYTSARIGFWPQVQGSSALAEGVVKRYPRLSHQKVYYRAEDPADGVLDLGWKWQPLLYAIGGLGGAWLTLRIILSNASREPRASVPWTRRWTIPDIVATAIAASLAAFLLLNLCWFE